MVGIRVASSGPLGIGRCLIVLLGGRAQLQELLDQYKKSDGVYQFKKSSRLKRDLEILPWMVFSSLRENLH